MKTKMKVLSLMLAAVLLVSATVAGTMAYLTSTANVTNTFTVGKVAIALDETDVTLTGEKDTDERVSKNDYKLIPGHTYIKDPIVHFDGESEAAYLYIKVDNGIADIESEADGYVSIATQITANGWTALPGVDGVYYIDNATAGSDYPVFGSFTVDSAKDLTDYDGKTVTVTAYAVQKDGFDDAAAAWNATFGK